jgi:hypothetical protein
MGGIIKGPDPTHYNIAIIVFGQVRTFSWQRIYLKKVPGIA